MVYVKNATIYTPQRVIEEGAVVVENGRFQAAGPLAEIPPPPAAQVIDAGGLLLVPGFIDVQCNGGFGLDFTRDPAAIWDVARRLPQYGVTAFLPTVITAPLETYQGAQAVLAGGPPADFAGAVPLGLHIEGPFLSPAKKGAHHPAHLRPPSLTAIATWSPQRGVRLVTLAPELPGATAVIGALAARGVVVAAGHSLASYAAARAGLAAGIRYGTHLFNAMGALHPRQPGLAGALLADERITVGLIADGIHVHPALVKMVWQAVGHGRLTLVTDAMAALGMPPGTYPLGDFEVTVGQRAARLAGGTLAGSILSLDAALRNLRTFTGCSLAAALATVTTTPAALLGYGERKGKIAPGFDADFVLLTPQGNVVCTIAGGKIVYGHL